MRRHSARATGAPALWLLSTSVLLALVWGGGVAHATDSSGIQYSDVPPTVTGDNPTKGSARKAIPATSSKADGGAAAPRSEGSDSRSSGGNSSDDQSSSRGEKPTAGGGDGTGQSSPDAGSTDKRTVAQADGQQLGAGVDDEDDGSSPLVPILIAVLVLAAISGAVVLMRARRAEGGPGDPDAHRAS
jgi:cobalamin biosynthesis Mg chelatase CobN